MIGHHGDGDSAVDSNTEMSKQIQSIVPAPGRERNGRSAAGLRLQRNAGPGPVAGGDVSVHAGSSDGRESLLKAVEYLCEVLGQGQHIADAVEAAGLTFVDQVGPQLRHVLEHVEQFLAGVDPGVIDYDRRARDRDVERQPELARRRFANAVAVLRVRGREPWPDTVTLSADGGLDGAVRFTCGSTPLRELLFLASHAIHHYAIVRVVLRQQGLALPELLGMAPATVRYRREHSA